MDYTNHWTSTDQVPLASIEDGTLGRYSAVDPTDGGNSTRAAVTGEWHAHDEHGYTTLSAYAQHYKLKLWSELHVLRGRPEQQATSSSRRSRATWSAARCVHGWQHALFGNDSTTEAGLQVRHDHIDVGLLHTEARVPFGHRQRRPRERDPARRVRAEHHHLAAVAAHAGGRARGPRR